MKLLAGLLDTDGFYDQKKKYYEIIQKSKRLAEQIVFLARSLGFAAYINKKVATIKDIDFEGDYWRVTISGDLLKIPCLVERKKPKERLCEKDVSVVGISVEKAGYGEYYGFEVDGDGRFLLGRFYGNSQFDHLHDHKINSPSFEESEFKNSSCVEDHEKRGSIS